MRPHGPGFLEGYLLEQGLSIQVWNAGFPGWTSLENLISLSIRDVDLLPDVVVLYQGINDLQPAFHTPFDSQYERHADIALASVGFHAEPPAWYQKSLLVEKSRDTIFGSKEQSPPPENRSVRQDTIPAAAISTFKRNVRSYIAVAQAHNAVVLLVTQSLRIRKSHQAQDRAFLKRWIIGIEADAIITELQKLNDIVRSFADDDRVIVADAALDVIWKDEDYDDPMHFSSTGSRRFAQYMSRVLSPLLSKLLEGSHTL